MSRWTWRRTELPFSRPLPSRPLRWALAAGLLILAACAPAADPPAGGGEATTGADEAAAPAPSWQRLPAPEIPEDRPLVAGFLILDGVYNSELMAPYDIFHHTVFHTEPGMTVFTVSPDGAPVTSFEGLEIGAHYSFDDAPAIDVLVVPSAESNLTTDLDDERLIAWVRERGAAARWVMSLCDGAFVLAQAGLLDNVAATTFPGDQDAFAERFPHIDLRRGTSFVHQGQAITGEGGAKSYDPAMYLVDWLYGEEVARGVGRGLIIPWPPEPVTIHGTVIADEPSES